MCVFRLLCCLSALCALLRVFISVSFHSDECVLCMCLLFCASLCSRYYSTGPFLVNANRRLMYANMICRRVSTFRSLTHIGTEEAEKKCLQNCVCVSPEPSRRYVCECILGIFAQKTHTHILGLWFNNSLLRLFYVFLFGFGILVVAAACRPLSHSLPNKNKCPSCGATLCQNLELIAICIHIGDIRTSYPHSNTHSISNCCLRNTAYFNDCVFFLLFSSLFYFVFVCKLTSYERCEVCFRCFAVFKQLDLVLSMFSNFA